jgi:hypothetical protein
MILVPRDRCSLVAVHQSSRRVLRGGVDVGVVESRRRKRIRQRSARCGTRRGRSRHRPHFQAQEEEESVGQRRNQNQGEALVTDVIAFGQGRISKDSPKYR